LNGNALSDGTNAHTSNARNQRVSIKTDSESFQYDTFGLLAGGVDQYSQRTDSPGERNFLTDADGILAIEQTVF
jgi:hypothetical protein